MRIRFAAGRNSAEISWSDESLSGTLRLLFAPWQEDDDGSDHALTIRQSDGGYLLTAPGSPTFCPDREALVARVEHTLTLLGVAGLDQFVQIHAATVDLEGNGALIVGPHGCGKTTLALSAITRGFRALGDDVAVVGDDGRAFGFPRPFRAVPGALALRPGVIPSDCPRFPVHSILTYVFFTSPPGKYYTGSTRLRHIFFPVRREGTLPVRRLGSAEALNRLLPQGFNYDRRLSGIARELIHLLTQAPPLEIASGDRWEAVETMRGVLS